MAEQLAFEQRVYQCRAVAHGEALARHGAELMQRPCDKLFSRAGRAGDQHVTEMARHFSRQIEHLEHRRAFPHDALELRVVKEPFLEFSDLGTLREEGCQFVERFLQAGIVEGLADKIVSAALDGLDRRLHIVEGGHQDHVDAGIVLQGLLQEHQPIHCRHFEIGQHGAAASDANLMKRVLRVRGSDHGEAGFVEPACRDFHLAGIVVQDADG